MYLKPILLFLFCFLSLQSIAQSQFEQLAQKLKLVQFDSNEHVNLFTYINFSHVLQLVEFKNDSVVAYFNTYALTSKLGKKDTLYKTRIYTDENLKKQWREFDTKKFDFFEFSDISFSDLDDNINGNFKFENADTCLQSNHLTPNFSLQNEFMGRITCFYNVLVLPNFKYTYPDINTIFLDGDYYCKNLPSPSLGYEGFGDYSFGIGLSHHIGIWKVNERFDKNPRVYFNLAFLQNRKNDKIAKADFSFRFLKRKEVHVNNMIQSTQENINYKTVINTNICGNFFGQFDYLEIDGGLNYSYSNKSNLGINANAKYINSNLTLRIEASGEYYIDRFDYSMHIRKQFTWKTKDLKQRYFDVKLGYEKLFNTQGVTYGVSFRLPKKKSPCKYSIISI